MRFNQKSWKGSDTIVVKKLFSSVRFLGIEKSLFSFLNKSRVYSYFLKNEWQRVFLHSNPVKKFLCAIYTNEGSKKILIKTRGRGTNVIELTLISSSEKSEKEKSNHEGRRSEK